MKTLLKLLLLTIVFSCNNNSATKKDNTQIEPDRPSVIKKHYLKRPGYKMEYLHTWTIDSTDNDFSIDSYFTLNTASDNGFVSFFIFNTYVDQKELIDAQVEANLKKTLKNGKVVYFTSWGNYKGMGATINGKLLGLMDGEVKAFAYSNDSSSFLIVSQLFDSDKQQDEPGLKLIETSFRITH